MTAEEAAGIMMSGGGSTTAETMYDRISKLPAVFAFDVADGWRCEICVDNNPTKYPQSIGYRYDNWSDEFTSTVTVTIPTKTFYLRVFKGSELKMVTEAVQTGGISKWYEANGVNADIGDLKSTVITEYNDFGIHSIGTYGTNMVTLPQIFIDYKMTQTTNGVVATYNGYTSYTSPSTRFFENGEFSVATYAEFVKAVRKMSDEYNKTEEE